MVIVIDSQIAGISGDMLLCSLIDLGADKSKILSGINVAKQYLPGSKINHLDFVKKKKHGINATCMELDISENVHERHGVEIKNCLENSLKSINVSTKAKNYCLSCIDTLISAESKIHDSPPDSVHFHEASSIDTVIDILGCTIALDDLDFFNDDIISTKVAIGGGSIDFSHGVSSNPAPAILEIFKNSKLVIQGGSVLDELTTPTGACLLVNLTKRSHQFYPSLQVESIGYGGGTKDFEKFSNVLKIVKGKDSSILTDSITVVETNVDDVSGEILGNLIEKIMNADAKDVTISSAITKKNRPTNLVTVLCDDNTVNNIVEILINETGTLGIRIRHDERIIQPRVIKHKIININGVEFSIRLKVNPLTNKVFKLEFDDIKNVSDKLQIPLREAEDLMRDSIKFDE